MKKMGISINGKRSGFFFTVLALIALTFMLISVQAWAQAQQLQERRAAERFRIDAFKSTIAFVDENALNKFANASLYYSLHKLSTGIANSACPSSDGFLVFYNGPSNEYPDGTYVVAKSVAELMASGTTRAAPAGAASPFDCYPGGNLSFDPSERDYTLSNYFQKTSETARMLGYNLTWGEIKNFAVNQSSATGPWVVTVKFDVDASLTDSGGFSLNRQMHVNTQVDINGLEDPFIAGMDRLERGGTDSRLRPHKQVFHIDTYKTPQNAKGKIEASSSEARGLGWFYGTITNVKHTGFSENNTQYTLSKIGNYIFKTGSASDAINESAYFGGVILTAQPAYVNKGVQAIDSCQYNVSDMTNCLYCLRKAVPVSGGCSATRWFIITSTAPQKNTPFMILPSFNENTIKPNYRTGLPEGLISNRKGFDPILSDPDFKQQQYYDITGQQDDFVPFNADDSAIWNLNGPRDMAICGYYVASANGPSYLKRFTSFMTQASAPYSPGMGIESFVVGKWAGGADDPLATSDPFASSETFSRLDYQFYAYVATWGNACQGLFIKGMPGCRDSETCASEGPRVNATGRFAIDGIPGSNYNMLPLNVTIAGGATLTWCNYP